MKTQLPNRALALLLGSVTLALVSAACGGSSTGTTGGTGGTALVTSSSSTTTSTTTTSTSSSSGTGGTGTTTTGTTTTTTSSSGCFAGTPMTNEEFLNACVTGMTCQALTTQLPLLEPDGGLPALP
jgi:endoglucanase